ncbi:hypothetical protein ACWGI8_11435 [Streptomyces sp. NPDC054841]
MGVIGLRLVDLAVRYAVTFAVTWAAVDASLPADAVETEGWLAFFPVIGIPSILISFVYGLGNSRTGAAFRGPLAGLLLLPIWFLLFGNFPEMLSIPVAGQVLFALCVMRAPFLSPSQLRRRARAAFDAGPALPGRLACFIRRAVVRCRRSRRAEHRQTEASKGTGRA